MEQTLGNTVWQLLTKLNIVLAYDPTFAFLVMCVTNLKTYVHTETCMQIFIAALCIITKNWKQPVYPLIIEWINKLWYIHTMEHYSVIKRNELHAMTRHG